SEWETWVRRKLAPALADLDEISSEALPSWKARPPGRPPITHLRVCYTGTATVVDEDALARLVAEGVGPGKAFGCGLLLVRSEEHTSELQSRENLVCRLLLEKKKIKNEVLKS